MSSSPDLFTTLRYIPSGGPSAKTNDIPLFDLHVQRLRGGVEHFGELVESKEEEIDWEMEVWRVLEQVIVEKGVKKGLRLKVTVAVSSPPSFKAEAWILPDTFPPFVDRLPSSPPSPSSTLPQITLSPSPLTFTPSQVPLLLFKTSDRKIYDEHTSLTLPTHPSTQSTLLYTSSPSSLLTETTIANVLFLPASSSTWITPRITSSTPLLPGLMREDLLRRGEIVQGDVTLEEAREWLKEGGGGRAVCCNALRGVWEVRVEFGGAGRN